MSSALLARAKPLTRIEDVGALPARSFHLGFDKLDLALAHLVRRTYRNNHSFCETSSAASAGSAPQRQIARRESHDSLMGLAAELQKIYDSEINIRIGWLWDGGIEVRLGDEMNGF